MGRITNPLKVHWSGGVDGLVGYWRYGASYFRSFAQSIRNPRTDAQTTTRVHFTALSELLSQTNPAYKAGFAAYVGDGRGPRQIAAKENWGIVTVGPAPTFATTIDFTKLAMSRGSLINAYNLTAAAAAGQINLTWTDNSGISTARATDKGNAMILNVTKGESLYYDTFTRADEGVELAVPAAWSGDTVHVYIYFVGEGTGASDTSHVAQLVIS